MTDPMRRVGGRIAVILRCVTLLAAVVIIASRRLLETHDLSAAHAAFLAAAAAYVLASSTHRAAQSKGRRLDTILVSIDVLLVSGIVWITGAVASDYYLLYFVPVLHASLRLNVREAVTASLLAAACYSFVGFAAAPEGRIVTSSAMRMITVGVTGLALAVFFSLTAREIQARGNRIRQLQDVVDRLSALYEVARSAASNEDPATILNQTLRQAIALSRAEGGILMLADRLGRLQVKAVSPPWAEDDQPREAPDPARAEQAFATGEVVEGEHVLILPQTPQPHKRLQGYTVSVPLSVADTAIGVLQLWSTDADAFTSEKMEVLIVVCREASRVIRSVGALWETDRLARTDPLTRLWNRREFERRLQEEVERARRYGSRPSLAVFDVDSLKQVNDVHGHLAGDEALKMVANALRGGVRRTDFAARLGGDEFAVILSETDPEGAVIAVERILAFLRERDLIVGESAVGRVTLTAGVAGLADWETPLELFDRADSALRRAKQDGKDRLVCDACVLDAGGRLQEVA